MTMLKRLSVALAALLTAAVWSAPVFAQDEAPPAEQEGTTSEAPADSSGDAAPSDAAGEEKPAE